jgi:methylglyoxal synthase
MPLRDPTILDNVSDDTSGERDVTIMMVLAEALSENWLNSETLISMMDTHNGVICYDDFFDCMNQFGFADKVDLGKAFNFVAKGEKGFRPDGLLDELNKALDMVTACNAVEASKEAQLPAQSRHRKMVALVAHNNMKPSMMNFVSQHIKFFKKCKLVTTGSTGRSLTSLGLEMERLVSSGPLGGDQEIGGMISQGDVAAVFFFTDPLTAHPHDDDIKALIRICSVHDCITASNPSTGNALVFALENSSYGLSRLMGLNPSMRTDSAIVQSYLANQTKVIKECIQKKQASTTNTNESRVSMRMSIRRSSQMNFLQAGAHFI